MAGAVMNNALKILTDLKGGNNFSGTDAVGQGAKDVGKVVDRVFLEEDKQVREIVKNKGELANPENRKAVIKAINQAKGNIKTVLSGLQEKDVYKTIEDFQNMFLVGIAVGMSIGNIKMALALTPELLQGEPPVKNKPADETSPNVSIGETSNGIKQDSNYIKAVLAGTSETSNGIKPGDVDKSVEESFADADRFVKQLADRREELAKPGNRKEAEEIIKEIKTNITEYLGSMTEKDLPKNADKTRESFLEAFVGGMIAGSMKTALALIPTRTM